jgi:hypothetical protein
MHVVHPGKRREKHAHNKHNETYHSEPTEKEQDEDSIAIESTSSVEEDCVLADVVGPSEDYHTHTGALNAIVLEVIQSLSPKVQKL